MVYVAYASFEEAFILNVMPGGDICPPSGLQEHHEDVTSSSWSQADEPEVSEDADFSVVTCQGGCWASAGVSR